MSDTLTNSIQKRISQTGGWLPFDIFMRDALYAPEFGYYESAEVFGEPGDFVTGPDIGPWLALALSDLVHWGWQQMGCPADWSLIEQGGGSGRLLCELVNSLDRLGCPLPGRIITVETSEHMRRRQRILYQHEGLDVLQVSSLSKMDTCENGLYFCNELPDAFPVRCFVRRQQLMLERGVGWDGEGFVWRERPLEEPPEIDPVTMQAWPDGYISEWNPYLVSWQSDIAECMQRGYAFCVDYGYAASEYYRPDRREGTLLAHLNHQALEDVLTDPGSRDITAHIDFTALGKAGMRVGLDMGCWMTQGAWLAQSPSVHELLQQLAVSTDTKSVESISSAKRMMMPQGMGELFKLCVQSQNIPAKQPLFLTQFNRMQALGLTHTP
ncbi:MAG: SAM-dependent methyltransferase [Mariprofundaceae bacterium]|nr:SAM-dependent methyltransferase [Mariprofundaceae bacterium]